MRRRIIICLGLLLGFCVAGDVIAIVCLRSSIARLTTLAEAQRIQTLRVQLASSGVRLERDLLATIDREAEARVSPVNLTGFSASVEACNGCHHDEWVQSELDQLKHKLASFKSIYLSILRADEAATTSNADLAALAGQLTHLSTNMADRAAGHLKTQRSDAAVQVHRAWTVLMGTVIASLLMGGLVALHLKRRMTEPLEALLDGADRVRAGDLSYRFPVRGDEEFRALSDAFNRVSLSLHVAHEGMVQTEKMAAVGQFAAGFAHEVGNPLASISAVAQMMQRDCATDANRERTALILEHVARVSRIVKELLSFTRRQPDAPGAPVAVHDLVDNAVSLIRYDKRAGHARIDCAYDRDLNIESGHADRLLVTFTNVMLNALDALAVRDGAARLVISGQREDDRIVLRFTDNGSGMDDQQVRNAFEPFYTTKEPGAGTGLGLWICYQVVRKHGGTIWLDSRLDEGTTVVIELPCKRPGIAVGSLARTGTAVANSIPVRRQPVG